MLRSHDSGGEMSMAGEAQVDPSAAEPEEARRRISELEAKVEALMQQISTLQRTIVDWHSAMFGAI